MLCKFCSQSGIMRYGSEGEYLGSACPVCWSIGAGQAAIQAKTRKFVQLIDCGNGSFLALDTYGRVWQTESIMVGHWRRLPDRSRTLEYEETTNADKSDA